MLLNFEILESLVFGEEFFKMLSALTIVAGTTQREIHRYESEHFETTTTKTQLDFLLISWVGVRAGDHIRE